MYPHLTTAHPERQLASLTASLLTRNVHTPTIDKITILADLRNYQTNLEKIQLHPDLIDIEPDYSMHYKNRLKLASDLFVQLACPVSAPVPHLRIEFNPNKFNPTHTLWPTLFPMLKNKRISRIDYAIDYPADLSTWGFTTDRPRKMQTFQAPSGKLETLYLGTRTSKNQYRIYDKAKEQGQCDSLATSPLWRIEQQFTLDTKTEFWMLRPFSDLTVWRPSDMTGDYIDDLVLTDLSKNSKNWARLSRRKYAYYRKLIQDTHVVHHLPQKPVTTFQQGYPPLKAFLEDLLI